MRRNAYIALPIAALAVARFGAGRVLSAGLALMAAGLALFGRVSADGNSSRQVGGALGLALLASLWVLYTSHLVDSDYRTPVPALTDGFRLAFLIGAGLAAAGAVLAAVRTPAEVGPPALALAASPPREPARGPFAPEASATAPARAARGAARPGAGPGRPPRPTTSRPAESEPATVRRPRVLRTLPDGQPWPAAAVSDPTTARRSAPGER